MIFERLTVGEIAIDPDIPVKTHEGIPVLWRCVSSDEVMSRRSFRCSEGQADLSMSDNGAVFDLKGSCEEFVLHATSHGAHDVVRLRQRDIQCVCQIHLGLTDRLSTSHEAVNTSVSG